MNRWTSSQKALLKTLVYFLMFILLSIIVLIIGLMVGYGVIGDGKPLSILNQEVWKNLMSYF
ncbi:DNA-directed RNA polymerase subunit beta [Atopobacter phocae]|uniref:DNA-directed RNA polymerase subunit beta n=1 Tax=Atopobacter phocae TaxID=136492 RepID=UPI0004712659|nr:DNA-directed RNA polymerase subunit beta [Atopobacter phocae]